MAGQGLGVQRAELGEHGEQQVGGSRSGTADEQDGEDAEAGDQHPAGGGADQGHEYAEDLADTGDDFLGEAHVDVKTPAITPITVSDRR